MEELNFTLDFEGTYIHLIRVGFNDKSEIFIHPLPAKSKENFYRLDGSVTKKIDHISFHKDGTVHVKSKDAKYDKIGKYDNDIFSSHKDISNSPFFLISLYLDGVKSYIPAHKNTKPLDHTIIDKNMLGGSLGDFSIIFFMSDTSYNFKDGERTVKSGVIKRALPKGNVVLPKEFEQYKEFVSPSMNFCIQPKEADLSNLK